ncbi:MAG: hypothetical protein WCP96_07800 [Methylococcaceae bacterium]
MAEKLEMPCVRIPKIAKVPSINILGIAELKGMMDFSTGTPKDCTLSINLMLQLAPLLASMTCLLRILAVLQALPKFVKNPLTETTELLGKLGELSECFGAILPINIAITIKSILSLVISFLSCFLEQLDSLVKFQAGIDLKSAEGNPDLKLSLECAQANAKISTDNLMLSLQTIQPLLDMTINLGGVAGFDLKLPNLSDLSANQDQAAVINSLSQGVKDLQNAINALPG